MEFANSSEFTAVFGMACKAWIRRQELRTNIDGIPAVRDDLLDTESRYRKLIQDLSTAAARFIDQVNEGLSRPLSPEAHVSAHLLMESGNVAPLTNGISEETAKLHWTCAGALHVCSDSTFDRCTPELLNGGHPWVLDALASPISRRGKRDYLTTLNNSITASNSPSSYVVRALGLIGDETSRESLESILKSTDPTTDFPLACSAARSLYLMGSTMGREFYRREIESEQMHVHDMTWWYSMFGCEQDIEFLTTRIDLTNVTDWKIGLIQGLGYLGHINGVTQLLQHSLDNDLGVRNAVRDSLFLILGVEAEVDPEDARAFSEWWSKWWSQKQVEFDPSLRHREGKAHTIELCAEGLDHPIPEERARPHIDLIAYTGNQLPFDPEALLTDQEDSACAWSEWIAENKEDFPAGGWWLWN